MILKQPQATSELFGNTIAQLVKKNPKLPIIPIVDRDFEVLFFDFDSNVDSGVGSLSKPFISDYFIFNSSNHCKNIWLRRDIEYLKNELSMSNDVDFFKYFGFYEEEIIWKKAILFYVSAIPIWEYETV